MYRIEKTSGAGHAIIHQPAVDHRSEDLGDALAPALRDIEQGARPGGGQEQSDLNYIIVSGPSWDHRFGSA
jgi:hypothetical protein